MSSPSLTSNNQFYNFIFTKYENSDHILNGNQTNNKQDRWESGSSRFFSLAIILELSLHIYSIFPPLLQQMHRPQTCIVTGKLLASTYQVFKRTLKRQLQCWQNILCNSPWFYCAMCTQLFNMPWTWVSCLSCLKSRTQKLASINPLRRTNIAY